MIKHLSVNNKAIKVFGIKRCTPMFIPSTFMVYFLHLNIGSFQNLFSIRINMVIARRKAG